MPERLKNLFDRALDDEPVPPDGDLAQQVMAQGRGIRRRRRGLLVGGSTATAIVAVVAALNLTPEPAGPPPQMSVAAAWMAQAEPQCTWSVSDDATDAAIFLRPDITGQQRVALQDALRADPLVRNPLFESKEEVCVCAVFDCRHCHDVAVFVDFVEDAIRASSGRPRALEGWQKQPFAHAMRVVEECGGDELVDRCRDLFR